MRFLVQRKAKQLLIRISLALLIGVLFFVLARAAQSGVERVFVGPYSPRHLTYGRPSVRTIDGGLEIAGDGEPAGVYLTYSLKPSDRYRLLIQGEPISGSTTLRLRLDDGPLEYGPAPDGIREINLHGVQEIELLFYADSRFGYRLRSVEVERCPTCKTNDDLKEMLLRDISGLEKALGSDRLEAARLLLNWSANTADFAITSDLEREFDQHISSPPGQLYFRGFLPDEAAAYCSGIAVFYQRVLHLFDYDSFTINFGDLASDLTHVTVVVPVKERDEVRYYIFDPTFNLTFHHRQTDDYATVTEILDLVAQSRSADVIVREYPLKERDYATSEQALKAPHHGWIHECVDRGILKKSKGTKRIYECPNFGLGTYFKLHKDPYEYNGYPADERGLLALLTKRVFHVASSPNPDTSKGFQVELKKRGVAFGPEEDSCAPPPSSLPGNFATRPIWSNGMTIPTLKSRTIEISEPALPLTTLLAPHGTVTETPIIFKWNAVPKASKYQFEVYDDMKKSYVIWKIARKNCFTADSKLDSGHAFRWRVRALRGRQWSRFSDWLGFQYSQPGDNDDQPIDYESIKRIFEEHYHQIVHTYTGDSTKYYKYVPSFDIHETCAHEVARGGQLLLAGYQYYRDTPLAQNFLEKATIAADSLIEHPDQDNDGKYGYGRVWPVRGNHVVDGGYTYWPDGSCQRNNVYQEEMFDSSNVIRFLLEMYLVTDKAAYLDVARRVLEDARNHFGEKIDSDKFHFWKTGGECERSWFIKNTNIAFGRNLFLLYRITGDPKYKQWGEEVRNMEIWELENGNFGYFGLFDLLNGFRQSAVTGYQTLAPSPTALVECLIAGCWDHLPMEAFSLYEIDRFNNDRRNMKYIERIMDVYGSSVHGQCSTALPDSLGYCTAYYCFLKNESDLYLRKCVDAVVNTRNGSALTGWSMLYPKLQAPTDFSGNR